ncbi:DNA-binding XRE family transcriptional regulator [Bradyrhizobium sp. AZCC 1719]|uniref:helix-turn-helix transcriptional regulator n=1 Tax=Bradyrhizobium sp. AZCC 1719 TaxID=3117028 RepID=UPI002FF06E73
MSMSPQQCRGARAFLDWTQGQLAKAADVGDSTVRNFEGELRETSAANIAKMKAALERAGIEFIPARNGHGGGVRYAKER